MRRLYSSREGFPEQRFYDQVDTSLVPANYVMQYPKQRCTEIPSTSIRLSSAFVAQAIAGMILSSNSPRFIRRATRRNIYEA